ncbi:hypothetical protein NZNM25_10830 [Nitrosopumilus zosterae]|uniref:Uncharacterized protein n=1 Tax=Nitrosopumilus zosterae TaxID=718286 RepID=A0A2S2KRJ2_9ARCH|nr:hypothetical protein [Nitrosopumilus zosterae]BDQ30269.1 hypothetical protein NZOSNM25_000370 [Nitrosopumilus zosterae]GBH34292.1 hypothetical protein NZNM25_10830 [Nitrosopumilus zosterae]
MKTSFLAIFVVAVLLTGTIAGPIGLIQSADALKSKGNSASAINSKKVCGDRLCSEPPKNEVKSSDKTKEEIKSEKKTESATKAQEAPKKDAKSETMEKAQEIATLKVPKTVTGVITSVQDPGQGHENHQLAILLPPSDKVYRGYVSFTATENVQLVALHGPLKAGMDKGQAIWTTDGKTKFGLTFVDKESSTGVWQFTGNAVALHTKNTEPFTVSYSITYTEQIVDGQKVFRSTMTSVQDPGIGHENHQLALLLAPRDKAYSGYLTYDASEPVQIVTLIGPLSQGELRGLPSWTPDGETFFALSIVPTKASGSVQFSGNAIALHTTNTEPFTVSYSLVLTK